jgi:hypothetical protein
VYNNKTSTRETAMCDDSLSAPLDTQTKNIFLFFFSFSFFETLIAGRGEGAQLKLPSRGQLRGKTNFSAKLSEIPRAADFM